MVTTIFPTLWPEVSALCASRNWLKWNFRMGGTEILPPSIQLWSCFKYFSPVSISSEKKLLGYKCNFCATIRFPAMDSTAIQQLSDFLADGQLLSKEQVESQDCLWVQGQKHWILSASVVKHPSWSQADVEMLLNDVSFFVCDMIFSQASKCGVRAKSIAMRIQFRGDSAPNPPSHLGRFEWKPYLNIKIYQDQAFENQCLDALNVCLSRSKCHTPPIFRFLRKIRKWIC